MPISTALAVFWLIWWVVLFAVLPWGVRSQQEGDTTVPGSDPGAPAISHMKWKLLWTTVVASVIFAGFYVVYVNQLVSLEYLASPFHFKD